ncbi:MAG: class I SAM-dependent methyltransferase [Phycisphaerae bacterium]|nr:class I SAM-dependent methyltransferase [Phycisphaerae bacterium]
MVYLADIPSEDDLSRLYRSYGRYKGYVGQGAEPRPLTRWQRYLKARGDFLLHILDIEGIAGQRLCELGAAHGEFLQLARARGAAVCGIDLDTEARGYLSRRLGIESHAHIAEAEGSFDVVCAKSVMEHIADPGGTLSDIRERLAGDGRLLISVPNGANSDVIGPTWAGFRVDLEHLNYWSPATMARLLGRLGLYVEQYWEMGQLWVQRKCRKGSLLERIRARALGSSSWNPMSTGQATLAVLARRAAV